jgi:hypothetical protein
MPKSSLDVEINVPVPTVSDANLPPTRVMQVLKNKTPCPFILRRGWCLKLKVNSATFVIEIWLIMIKLASISTIEKAPYFVPFYVRRAIV